MNKNIQPKYFDKTTIKCACGATFEVGSTVDAVEVEICSKCHPFYTGKERRTGDVGRVQKFNERLSKIKK